jgi:sugar lactone lactonase YvrE
VKRSTPELVLDARFELGEGPLWDVSTSTWLGVDALSRLVWAMSARFDPAIRIKPVPDVPGHIALRQAGGLLAGTVDSFVALDEQAGTWGLVASLGADEAGNRINDGAVDVTGALWAGTMHDVAPDDRRPAGRLYRLSPDGRLTCKDTGFGVSNGIGWSPDQRTMYLADTWAGVVYAYDFDPDAGAISRRRVLVDRAAGPGAPDGLAVDSSGALWVARWQGGCIARYSPNGRPDGRWPLPVPNVTSLCFGGAGLRTLLITTARHRLGATDLLRYPLSGGVFAMEADTAGVPGNLFGA